MQPRGATELLLIARRPAEGRVKTRLAAMLGARAACLLYAAMAEDTWRAMRQTGRRCHLTSDGEESWLPGAARVWPQPPGPFGERLASVLEALAGTGCAAVLVLAGDTPQLGREAIEQAAARLEQGRPLLCRPARDGGLVLLGLHLPAPLELRDLCWESSALERSLLARARQQRVPLVRLLPPSYDVDDLDDLARLLEEPAEVRDRCPSLVAAARRLGLQLAEADAQTPQPGGAGNATDAWKA